MKDGDTFEKQIERFVEAIRKRQAREDVHPLTCGYDSNHRVLEPYALPNGGVVMYCPDCQWVQTSFPLNWVLEDNDAN